MGIEEAFVVFAQPIVPWSLKTALLSDPLDHRSKTLEAMFQLLSTIA